MHCCRFVLYRSSSNNKDQHCQDGKLLILLILLRGTPSAPKAGQIVC